MEQRGSRVRGPGRRARPGIGAPEPGGQAPARARPDAGRVVGVVRRAPRGGRLARRGGLGRATGHAAGRPRRRARSRRRRCCGGRSRSTSAPASRPAPRDRARAARGPDQRDAGVRGPAGARAGPPTGSACSPTRTTSRPCSSRAKTSSPRRIGDGWYRGGLGWKPQDDRCTYGSEIGLIAQLEVGRPPESGWSIATDGDWQASTGEIRSADLYDGCVDRPPRSVSPGWDAPGFDDAGWAPARACSTSSRRVSSPEPRRPSGSSRSCPSRRTARGPRRDAARRRARTSPGSSGCRSAAAPASRSGCGTRRSSSPTARCTLRSLRSRARRPTPTSSPTTPTRSSSRRSRSTASATPRSRPTPSSSTPRSSRSAATRRRGRPSRARTRALNRLHENVVWSQRDNFVSVPTDCPQRDERLGWTGDAQAFAPTGSTLFDAQAFWRSWLRDLALEQDADARRPERGPERGARRGRSGWAGPAGPTPRRSCRGRCTRRTATRPSSQTQLAEHARVGRFARRAPGCRRAAGRVAAVRRLAGPGRPGWTGPGRPRPTQSSSPTRSSRTARASSADAARAPRGRRGHCALRGARRRRRGTRPGHAGGTTRVTTQTGCAVALGLGIAPESERAEVAEALATLVREADGRVATGFLGTPLVLPALSDAGHLDEAYRMLLRRRCRPGCTRSTKGATTVWERWDAILPDGSIHPGTMTPPRGRERRPGRPHALVQPLRLRRGDRLGLPPRRRARPRRSTRPAIAR